MAGLGVAGPRWASGGSIGALAIGLRVRARLVVADTSTLETLPPRAYRSGLAEVVKTSMLDAAFHRAMFEWLEDERRKDKMIIQTLEERLATFEREIPGLVQKSKEIGSEVTRLSAMLAKFDQIDSSLAQVRVDLARSIDSAEKGRVERERELEKARQADLEAVSSSSAPSTDAAAESPAVSGTSEATASSSESTATPSAGSEGTETPPASVP